MFLERLPEFIGNHPILSFAFVGLLIALIVTEIRLRTRRFTSVSPAQLTRLINSEDAAVVDVSALTDYERGHIVGATHILPSQLDPAGPILSKLKDRPVVLYCKNGMASEQAAKKLADAGFERVHWLGGGMASWKAENMPVARGKR